MTLDAWVADRPYLRPLAELASRVDRAAHEIEISVAPIPAWERYAGDFAAGTPLLHSSAAGVDLEAAGKMTVELVERLLSSASLDPPIAGLSQLAAGLRRTPGAPRRVAASLLGDASFDLPAPGLLRYLGWTAAARYLSPVVKAFAAWRDEDRWQRPYCPTCGWPPAMAQLVEAESSRIRRLSCGSCRTRWQYIRTACPFCEHDTQRAAVITVDGEGGLRIDHCESCRGYLKTYAGQGGEDVLLADWTSLHLDFAARDRGLKRLAGSLFDLQASAV